MTTKPNTPKTTSSKAAGKKPFDVSQYRPRERFAWREIERDDGENLRARLRLLCMRDAREIPAAPSTPLTELYAAIAPHVIEWTLTAEDITTGKVIPVPPPADAGPEVFDLLSTTEALQISTWILHPAQMKAAKAAEARERAAGTEPTLLRPDSPTTA